MDILFLFCVKKICLIGEIVFNNHAICVLLQSYSISLPIS